MSWWQWPNFTIRWRRGRQTEPEAPEGQDRQRLRQFAWGLALSTPLLTLATLFLPTPRGFILLKEVALIALLAFLWAFTLARTTAQLSARRAQQLLLWVNDGIILTLISAFIWATGGSQSPYFWLFMVLIGVEVVYHRRQGILVAWGSWAAYCLLLIAEHYSWSIFGRQQLIWTVDQTGLMWLLQAVGIAAWYLIIAIATSVGSREFTRLERELRERRATLTEQQDTLQTERHRIDAERRAMGIKLFETDQAKRQLERDRQRYEQERKEWDLERAQQAQRLADEQTSAKEHIEAAQQRTQEVGQLQQRLEAERATWEEHRARTVKTLDDREAELTERARGLDDAKQSFETQRVQTTQSLAQLEANLVARLQRVNDDVAHTEARRRELETAERDLGAQQEAWAKKQSHAAQALKRAAERIVIQLRELHEAQESVMKERQTAQEALQVREQAENTQRQVEERTAELAQREAAVTQQLSQVEARQGQTEALRQQLSEEAKRLQAQQALLDAERATWKQEHAQPSRKPTVADWLFARQAHRMLIAQAKRLREQGRALAKQRQDLEHRERQLAHPRPSAVRVDPQVQKDLEVAQHVLAEQRRALELQRAQWEQSRHATEEVLAAREQELLAQRHVLDERQRTVDRAHQQVNHASTQHERDVSARLGQVETLQQQLEQQRKDLVAQREQLELTRQQLSHEQHQVEVTRRQLDEARQHLADTSLTQTPDRFSAEALMLLANEFNTPLASLNALLATVVAGDHGEIPQPVLEVLTEMTTTNNQLRRVVTDALDSARLEHGQIHATIQPVKLQQLLSKVEEELRDAVAKKGLTLTSTGDASMLILTDPEHAHRILTTVLRNAVEYTQEGGVSVSCSTQQGQAVVTMTDTGVGIQSAQLPHLFAKPQMGSLLRGKGMSLYLARRLAKLMHSDVTLVASELESGSSFAVTFPQATTQPEAPAHASAVTKTNKGT